MLHNGMQLIDALYVLISTVSNRALFEHLLYCMWLHNIETSFPLSSSPPLEIFIEGVCTSFYRSCQKLKRLKAHTHLDRDTVEVRL